MRLPRRRARTAIAGSLEVVGALFCSLRRRLGSRDALRQFIHTRRQIIQHPVHPRACRRVRIVTNQRKALRAIRYSAPLERRRSVFAITGMFGWNRFTIFKRRAGERKFHGRILLSHAGVQTSDHVKYKRKQQTGHQRTTVLSMHADLLFIAVRTKHGSSDMTDRPYRNNDRPLWTPFILRIYSL